MNLLVRHYCRSVNCTTIVPILISECVCIYLLYFLWGRGLYRSLLTSITRVLTSCLSSGISIFTFISDGHSLPPRRVFLFVFLTHLSGQESLFLGLLQLDFNTSGAVTAECVLVLENHQRYGENLEKG